jgi:DNA-binding NtrC family response regulator
MSASSQPRIAIWITDGTFRSDLLYRINGFQIDLSPLRDRPEDIEPLARHLLKQLCGANTPDLTPEALEALRAYSWPGNVRQLRNCLERAVLLANDSLITLNELPPEVARQGGAPLPIMAAMSGGAAEAGGSTSAQGSSGSASPASLREVERQQILAALEQTGWHRGKTAEILGISPSTLYRRLRDYNLERRN